MGYLERFVKFLRTAEFVEGSLFLFTAILLAQEVISGDEIAEEPVFFVGMMLAWAIVAAKNQIIKVIDSNKGNN